MWLFSRKGPSGFSASSTAEEVTRGIDGTGLTAIITGTYSHSMEMFAFGMKMDEQRDFSLTRATSGIGAETARVLALRGVHVVMGIRDIKAGKKIKEEMIRDNSKGKIDVMELDLSSMESVRKFASQFNSCGLPLNILINNAGIMATPFKLSKDNIELQFATNHIGHFLLTNLLLDTMKQTSIEHRKEGRIVNVSSRRHRFSYPEGIQFAKINDKSGYNSLSAYGQSKLANVLHANELARLLKDEGLEITANSLHPGAIATNLFRHHNLIDVTRVPKGENAIVKAEAPTFGHPIQKVTKPVEAPPKYWPVPKSPSPPPPPHEASCAWVLLA
ncbi:short-chain dehydrogenase TIC 32, chloroplastic-like isoform X2 [Senna tora]|uniref:Short-chain dehydrogenase TIC 32, chloroplastic-like isoform X2 n=1 Tax=Senna tora TaxID=362788 RepID=A0A834W8M0_9FABA|nr:short-chain dehydrogenase TIC 32, chloroplastic-like isoform X2 [Senna tora]